MLAILAAALLAQETPARPEEGIASRWVVELQTPGGPLAFGLVLERQAETWSAHLENGEERIPVPRVVHDGRELLLDMPHYDSRIRARLDGTRWVGTWEKRRAAESTAKLDLVARGLYPCEGSGMPDERFFGRWRVDFEGDDQDAVALFSQGPTGLRGTFLTGTGDYRYLAGDTSGDELTLSCFDGAHAFLFKAKLQPDGSLKGDFWSGNWHHESWTAKRDDAAELADPFAQVRWNGTKRLEDLAFPDLLAKTRKLKSFTGPATLLVVFGSWCPNCNDEAALLKELDAQYRERGLRILLLAFELTGDFRRDAEQVRIFQERHGLAHLPAFLCGTADKAETTKALGLVDRVRAFPTTIFVGPDGLPKAIHSGFAGPATGEEHAKLRRDFAARIEALLPVR